MRKALCAAGAAILTFAAGLAVCRLAVLWNGLLCWLLPESPRQPFCYEVFAADRIINPVIAVMLPVAVALVAAALACTVLAPVTALWSWLYRHCCAYWGAS